ncbi:MAG: DNA polymerase ligase N-terminal domain-containing protein [Pirellulaceae bacterium]
MPRYVVLRHETPPNYARPLHWDLMLEADDWLWTWALEEPPRYDASIVAWPLADHRLEYLEYEGPVSNNRGVVARWDAGQYELIRRYDDEIVVRLGGEKLLGKATVIRQGGDDLDRDDHRWVAWFERE